MGFSKEETGSRPGKYQTEGDTAEEITMVVISTAMTLLADKQPYVDATKKLINSRGSSS